MTAADPPVGERHRGLPTLPDLALPDARTRRELAEDIRDAGLLRGDFALTSGERTAVYFDKYLFVTKPALLRRIGRALADLVPRDTDRLVALGPGALAIAVAVSLECGLAVVMAKRDGRGVGIAHFAGEIYPGDRVVLVEDVIATGERAILGAQHLRDAGATVVGVIAVVDRGQGGAAALDRAGVHLTALLGAADVGLGGSR